MHNYENNVGIWKGRTISEIIPIKNQDGWIEEIEIIFSDGWASRLWTQSNIIGVATMPNDPKLSHDAGAGASTASVAPELQQSSETAGTGGIGSSAVLGHMVENQKPLYTCKRSFALNEPFVTQKNMENIFKKFLKSSITHFSNDGRIVWTLQAAVYPHSHKKLIKKKV